MWTLKGCPATTTFLTPRCTWPSSQEEAGIPSHPIQQREPGCLCSRGMWGELFAWHMQARECGTWTVCNVCAVERCVGLPTQNMDRRQRGGLPALCTQCRRVMNNPCDLGGPGTCVPALMVYGPWVCSSRLLANWPALRQMKVRYRIWAFIFPFGKSL